METLANILAIVAAFIYVLGGAVQQKGILAAKLRGGSRIRALLTSPAWLLGLAIGLFGFGMHAVSLGIGSLAVVSLLQTTEVLYMLPFDAWTSRTKPRAADYAGSAVVLVGLVGIVVFGGVTAGIENPDPTSTAVALAACSAVFALLVTAAALLPRGKAALLGSAAGVMYGMMAALVKISADQLTHAGFAQTLVDWRLYALVAVGLAALAAQVLALSVGHLSAALSAIIVASPISGYALAVTIFEEKITTSGVGWIGLGVAIVLSIVGVLLLSGRPAVENQPTSVASVTASDSIAQP